MDRLPHRKFSLAAGLLVGMILAGCHTAPGIRPRMAETPAGLSSENTGAEASIERRAPDEAAHSGPVATISHLPALRFDDDLPFLEEPGLIPPASGSLPIPVEPATGEDSLPYAGEEANAEEVVISQGEAAIPGGAAERSGLPEPVVASDRSDVSVEIEAMPPREETRSAAAPASVPAAGPASVPTAGLTFDSSGRDGETVGDVVLVETEPVQDETRAARLNTSVADSPAEWLQRRVELRPQTEVAIVLPGSDWLFVGSEFGAGIAELIGKNLEGGNERFTFRFSEEGDYGLWFQRQSPISGEIENERLEVAVRPLALERVAVAEPGSLPVEGPSHSALPEAGSPLEPIGAALSVGRSPAPATDPGVIGEDVHSDADEANWVVLAEQAEAAGDLQRAGENWAMVVSEGGPQVASAGRRLFEIAQTLGNTGFLLRATDALESVGDLRAHDLLAAAILLEDETPAEAAALYNRILERPDGTINLDGIYFRLATMLEKPGPARDMRRARDLYERIVFVYPLSEHWDESSHRAEYIQRHFFDIR